MKFMNNHYGQSRIFGRRTHFRVPPMDGDGGSDGALDTGGSSGGSGEGGDNGASGDDGLSVDDLKIALAKAKADAEKLKNANDKLAKDNGRLTKEARARMNAEEQAKLDQEDRDKELAELKKEVRTARYSKRLVGFGMAEAEADELAGIIPDMEDSDAFFDSLGKFVENIKKTSAESAVQELLKNRPDINAGSGDGKTSIAEERAKEIAKSGRGGARTNDIAKLYAVGGKR